MSNADSFDSPEITADQSLLVEASWLLREGHRKLAILAAVKACDVAIVRSVRSKLDSMGKAQMYDCLTDSIGGFDLRHTNALQLYTSITGHNIQREATEIGVWSNYIAALDQHEKLFYDNADIQRDDAAVLVDHARR
jgi:hypothetical protein